MSGVMTDGVDRGRRARPQVELGLTREAFAGSFRFP